MRERCESRVEEREEEDARTRSGLPLHRPTRADTSHTACLGYLACSLTL